MNELLAALFAVIRYVLAGLALVIVLLCLVWLARRRKFVPQEAFLFSVVTRDKLPLERCENAVGRSPRCDVVLNYPTISRYHAVIALRREGWILFDTGSQIGTKINGEPIGLRASLQHGAPLEHGQILAFGSMEFLFCDPAAEREQEEQIRQQDAVYTVPQRENRIKKKADRRPK